MSEKCWSNQVPYPSTSWILSIPVTVFTVNASLLHSKYNFFKLLRIWSTLKGNLESWRRFSFPNTFPYRSMFLQFLVSAECSEIEQVVNSMATGIYKIPLRVIKDCLPAILSTLTSVVSNSLTSRIFPPMWKTPEVIPIHKQSDEKPENRRSGVSKEKVTDVNGWKMRLTLAIPVIVYMNKRLMTRLAA